MTQRYLSYDEYARRGYELKQDVVFDTGSYSSYGIDLNPFDYAYRSDTKEEYYVDLSVALFELGIAYVTGGQGRVARVAWQIFKESVIDN